MRVLVIIPAYNESESLPGLVDELRQKCPGHDVLVVDDCSTDGTAHCRMGKDVAVLRLPVNLGIGGAVQTGYRYAHEGGYDVAVQVDGDGQHDPGYVGTLVDGVIGGGSDICIGSRFLSEGGFRSTASRRVGIRILSALIRLTTGMRVKDPTSGFRACGRRAIELFASHYPTDYPEPETLVTARRFGMAVTEVPVRMRVRMGGKSSIAGMDSALYMVKVSIAIALAAVSKKPASGWRNKSREG